jgi:hypothetical protein
MSRYEIIKGAGRTMWCVHMEGVGNMRFYSKRECAVWIARAERSDKEAAEWKIADRAYRLDAVNAYLAKRAARAAYPTQFSFNF